MGGRPELLEAWRDERQLFFAFAVFICPLERCRFPYVAGYNRAVHEEFFFLTNPERLKPFAKPHTFSDVVAAISPDFVKIYGQAETAEAGSLTDICGAGYRRALEFLVKDFILKHEMKDSKDEEKKAVLESPLKKCIDRFIPYPQIQKVAERAAWLGNDETHYVRQWEDKDLVDLKRLITMTVDWIALVLDSAKYESDMPEKK